MQYYFAGVGDKGFTVTVACIDPITFAALGMLSGSATITMELNGIVQTKAMTIVNGAAGTVSYTFSASDLHTSGEMTCEVVATTSGGEVVKQPRFKIVVEDRLTVQ